jgi:prepilin-type N-terminal cleavage/methylation domain-containing protein
MRNKYQRGFSVIELIITMFLFTVLAGASYTMFRSLSVSNRVLSASISAQDEARKVLKPMVGEVRDATTSSTGLFAIETAHDMAFTFYSNIDGDAQIERVRYYLNGSTLKKGVINPSGSPLSYDSTTEAITPVIHNIANGTTPIFSYYDRNYTGTQAPLSTPPNLIDIRLLKVYVIIDPMGGLSPAPTTMTTQIQFRNLKDN